MQEVNRSYYKRRKPVQTVDDEYEENETAGESENEHEHNIFTFILLIFALLIYDVIRISREGAFDLNSARLDLLNSVYNQTEAVSVIIESLDRMHNHEQSVNVVNFIGPTGVGKTFVANILKKHFNPHTYELNNVENRQTVLDRIKLASSSDYSLVLVEDLTVADVDDVLSFVKEIPQEIVALVVCIFNIQETDSNLNHSINYDRVDEITSKFYKAEVGHNVAKFNEFDQNQAGIWITRQLTAKGVKPDSNVVESLLRNQNLKYRGLKGLSSKINLEL